MEYLKFWRNSKGLSQQRLASMTDLSISSVAKYESGATEPTIGKALRIADALEVDVRELVGRGRAEI